MTMLKEWIKWMSPKLYERIQRYRKNRKLKKGFAYDFRRYAAYSDRDDTEEALLAAMVLNCHSLEKGFTMPDFHVGFGVKKIRELLPQCCKFIKKYGRTNEQLLEIVRIVYEYRLCHQRLNAEISPLVAEKIDEFLALFPEVTSAHIQVDCCRDHYFDDVENPFPVFARSRHSVRFFSDIPVDPEVIKEAIQIATTSPSACNRQPVRVLMIADKEKIATVFSQHGGNRGFGHTVDKLLLICSYLPGYHGAYERNWGYVDAGIFTMNLAYALHYKKIGAVILNWNMQEERNKVIYDALHIPDYLTVVVMIAVGNIPENFKICRSYRKSADKYLVNV